MTERTNLAKLAAVRAMLRSGEAQRIRVDAGVSLREVADAIDVSVSALHRWEGGDRRPRGDAAIRYADLLGELSADLREREAVAS